MALLLLVFLGGVLTILSPCILPVLPFVFARSDRRFFSSGLPMLVGMAVTFAGIATLAAVGGAWAVRVNQGGRVAALILLTAFAATLLSRRLAERVGRPFVALGNRLAVSTPPGGTAGGGMWSSLSLGVATGLLWAPCAGPILGLVLTGAALSGPNARTTLLLFAYAAGAATSLGIAILAGGRVFAALKRSLGAGEWIRRTLGVAVLLGVVAIAFGWDTTVLTRLSLAGTNRWEESLLSRAAPGGVPASGNAADAAGSGARDAAGAMSGGARDATGSTGGARDAAGPPDAAAPDAATGAGAAAAGAAAAGGQLPVLPVEGHLPALGGATGWLNSPPLTPESLRGKVVLVDFWTYSCINCLRALPYVEGWFAKYKDHGLVVIGVHSPEFAFEKDPGNVRRAVADLGVEYPVALDADYALWRAFGNRYWPAHYFVDAKGMIRAHHFGEGGYEESETILRELLSEAGYQDLPAAGSSAPVAAAAGVRAAADESHLQSGETYIGYRRADGFRSPGGVVPDRVHAYAAPPSLALNQWALTGKWLDDPEKAVLQTAPGKILFRFSARDLHLVLGAAGKPVRFRVLLDGAAPGASHGADTDADGNGTVDGQRLYQLIRQSDHVGEHVFSIEFLDDGVQAYSFTFG